MDTLMFQIAVNHFSVCIDLGLFGVFNVLPLFFLRAPLLLLAELLIPTFVVVDDDDDVDSAKQRAG